MASKDDDFKNLREILNDWNGRIRSHFNLDDFERRIGKVEWNQISAKEDEEFKIRAKVPYNGKIYTITIRMDKNTEQMDGSIRFGSNFGLDVADIFRDEKGLNQFF